MLRHLLLATLGLTGRDQPCDPASPQQPRYVTSATLEDDLFADERAARGTCAPYRVDTDWRDSAVALAEKEALTASVATRCDGVCEPMRALLKPLDATHDLEDLTFQKECTVATAKLADKDKNLCLRVCVAERRFFAAPAVFARTVRALEATLPYQPGGGVKLSELRKTMKNSGFGAPPSTITFDEVSEEGQRHVRADGWVFPGGPALRLETTMVGTGCGHSAWGLAPW